MLTVTNFYLSESKARGLSLSQPHYKDGRYKSKKPKVLGDGAQALSSHPNPPEAQQPEGKQRELCRLLPQNWGSARAQSPGDGPSLLVAEPTPTPM